MPLCNEVVQGEVSIEQSFCVLFPPLSARSVKTCPVPVL